MSIFSFIKSHVVLASTLVVVVVAGSIIGGRLATREQVTENPDANLKRVSLVSVDSFRNDSSTVSADGSVKSVAQVDLKSQLGAPLQYVSVKLGDTVAAGQIIAELSNADIRAQLDQAQSSLSLEGVSLDQARRSAADAIRDSYLKADEAVHTQIDPLFLNKTGTTPQLSNFILDRTLYNEIQTIRMDLTRTFDEWKVQVDAIAPNSGDAKLQAGLALSRKNVDTIRNWIDKIQQGLNYTSTVALPADLVTLNEWKAIISAARTSMSGAASSLTTSQTSLASQLVTSGSISKTSVAEAGVKNLEAQLAKTVIRAPISGRIAALPLRAGEFAAPGQLIATIVGTGGLEVEAFASGQDIGRIERGARVTIRKIGQTATSTGTVSSVAPSVGETSKKVEVKIQVSNPSLSGLVVGENVSVSIEAKNTSSAAVATAYRLPIQNVKIIPGDAYVFTVDAESKIVKNAVTLGDIQGDYVEVKGGLNSGMNIVTPVYELEEGQKVIIE